MIETHKCFRQCAQLDLACSMLLMLLSELESWVRCAKACNLYYIDADLRAGENELKYCSTLSEQQVKPNSYVPLDYQGRSRAWLKRQYPPVIYKQKSN